MIQGIQIPDSITAVIQIQFFRIQTIGKIILKNLIDFAVFVFQNNVRSLVQCFHITLIAAQIFNSVTTIHDDHFGLA